MNMYLGDYSHFTNIHDLDKAVGQHRGENRPKINNTDDDILEMIHRHSVKSGAAHLRHETIEKGIGKSNSTVRRSLRKLNRLGIIDRIHYIHPDMGGLGANIYAIKPF